MELIAIGFLLGAVVVLTVLLIGLESRIRDAEKSLDRDDVRIYVPSRNKGHSKREMTEVLQMLRLGTCKHEQEVINEIIDMIEKGEGK